MIIGFLTCPGTASDSDNRRTDAFEHDLQVAALRPAFEAEGMALREIDWRADLAEFGGMDAVLIGTAWDYQDFESVFLAKLDMLSASGITVCNSPVTVRWNARKTYLQDLAQSGAATIPTLWRDTLAAADLKDAFAALETETLVIKRQVGANAEGQHLVSMDAPVPGDWHLDMPVMIQPFLPAIGESGEISFLFIDGEFSHALVKRPADGDYRVQSSYGGTEEAYVPTHSERAEASAIVTAIPHGVPLYARIDMVRGPDDQMLLMEAELIEPFLYPVQGPELGPRMAHGLKRRLAA